MNGGQSALKPSAYALSGVAVMVMATLTYGYEEGFMHFVTPERAGYFAQVAWLYLAVMLAAAGLVVLGLRRLIHARVVQMNSQGFAPLGPSWMIPYVLNQRRFRRQFILSALLYGLFYAVITSMIVYQPSVDFQQAYGAALPSVLIGPCCGPLLYTPVVTVYVVNHLGLLIIPLTAVLLASVSVLVGINFALAAFAFGNRARGSGRSWVGGLGAIVGLFTGCPTCAGLFFANVIGGTGAVSFASLLAYYQPLFVALGIPVLIATPYLISRSLFKVMKDGCVVLDGDRQSQSGLRGLAS